MLKVYQFFIFTAGDILKLKVHRTWEFNATAPVRSTVLPCLTSGSAFLLLRVAQEWFDIPITSHSLLVLPRFMVTIIGGLADIMVYKHSGSCGLLLWATSYITVVYFTRTLSNTLEAILFVALLHLVISDKNAQAVHSSEKALRALNEHGKAMEKKRKDKKSAYKKVRPPSTLDLSLDNECEVQTRFSDVFWLSVILAVGTFNRPTFLIYAFVPYVFWVFSACGSRDHHIATHSMDRVAVSAVITAFTSLILIICDSLYYGSLAPRNLIGIYRKLMVYKEMQKFLKSLTITPLNFILYNINPSNLSKHGLHPRIVHFVVNTPMLFGILSLFALYNIGKILETKVGINKKMRWGSVNKTHKFLLFSYFVPLIILSVFPHQEARFLVPLLAPLAMLYGQKVFGWTAWKPWGFLWIIPNLLAATFFGVFHQGGLVPCLQHLQNTTSQLPGQPTTHVIFYHTYMPPHHLFLMNQTSINSPKIHDLKGASIEKLHEMLDNITAKNSKNKIKIVSPSTLDQQFCKEYKDVAFKLNKYFPWHISMENPPNLPVDLTCKNAQVTSCNRPCEDAMIWDRAQMTFSIFLYDVVSNNKR